jgi:hypothetical protein
MWPPTSPRSQPARSDRCGRRAGGRGTLGLTADLVARLSTHRRLPGRVREMARSWRVPRPSDGRPVREMGPRNRPAAASRPIHSGDSAEPKCRFSADDRLPESQGSVMWAPTGCLMPSDANDSRQRRRRCGFSAPHRSGRRTPTRSCATHTWRHSAAGSRTPLNRTATSLAADEAWLTSSA